MAAVHDESGAVLARLSAPPIDGWVDTTGAGDAWAAGFLYGYLRGCPLPVCGAIGSLLGGENVQHLGAAILRWRLAGAALMLTAVVLVILG